MRDLVVITLVFASIPLILRKPFFGILMWTWISLMNPHRLCWGAAVDMPIALLVAATLILSFIISKEPKNIPSVPLTWLMGFWWFWLFISTLTAFYPDSAWGEWDRSWRTLLTTFLTIIMLTSRERIDALVWVMVLSLGLYGVKGGIFTLLGGGSSHVLGPAGSFIAGNTEIGLALVMTVPLMRYLQLTTQDHRVRIAMAVSIGLTLVAILGTQSRGALLGLIAITFYLALKSRNKAGMVLMLVLALPPAFMLMPESWYTRMDTIQTYEQDGSALGRINAWWTAWYMALDHPVVGGGFRAFQPPTFVQYAPEPARVHDVHSVYFEALGEHGFVGFFAFMGMMFSAWLGLNRVIRFAKRHPQLNWMRDLASMVYVSLIGYAVCGLFLGLAMFDFYYGLLAITVGLMVQMGRYQREGVPPMTETAAAVMAVSANQGLGQSARALRQNKGPLFGLDVKGWFEKL